MVWDGLVLFISHMVQIIQSSKSVPGSISYCPFISHMVQIILINNVYDNLLIFCNFISHMVQIIQSKETTQEIHGFLYIPHGSDNTKGLWCLKLNFFIFISHMVQIILLRPYAALWQYEELYIPHGSDNTRYFGK